LPTENQDYYHKGSQSESRNIEHFVEYLTVNAYLKIISKNLKCLVDTQ
jgi:hypothetical protein